jgi:uncharacterized protein YlzI (FlbEa/FlbD family)
MPAALKLVDFSPASYVVVIDRDFKDQVNETFKAFGGRYNGKVNKTGGFIIGKKIVSKEKLQEEVDRINKEFNLSEEKEDNNERKKEVFVDKYGKEKDAPRARNMRDEEEDVPQDEEQEGDDNGEEYQPTEEEIEQYIQKYGDRYYEDVEEDYEEEAPPSKRGGRNNYPPAPRNSRQRNPQYDEEDRDYRPRTRGSSQRANAPQKRQETTRKEVTFNTKNFATKDDIDLVNKRLVKLFNKILVLEKVVGKKE